MADHFRVYRKRRITAMGGGIPTRLSSYFCGIWGTSKCTMAKRHLRYGMKIRRQKLQSQGEESGGPPTFATRKVSRVSLMTRRRHLWEPCGTIRLRCRALRFLVRYPSSRRKEMAPTPKRSVLAQKSDLTASVKVLQMRWVLQEPRF